LKERRWETDLFILCGVPKHIRSDRAGFARRCRPLAREGDYERRKEELDRAERQIRAVIDAIKDGLRTPGMKEELYALDARKRGLAAEVKQAPAPRPRLHPKLADLYRQRVDRLHEELNRTELRSDAAQAPWRSGWHPGH